MLDLIIDLIAQNKNLDYCKRCQRKISDNSCAICGNPKELRRIDEKYLFDEIGRVLKLKKETLHMLKELLIRS